MARVLIVDDSELILQMLEMVVVQAGHEVTAVSTWNDAVSAYESTPPDLVITDLNLPDQPDPVAALAAMGEIPVVIVSGRPQAELDAIVAARGLAGAVSKDAGMMGMSAALPPLVDSICA